jgi:hypothetical protein
MTKEQVKYQIKNCNTELMLYKASKDERYLIKAKNTLKKLLQWKYEQAKIGNETLIERMLWT